MSAARLWKSVVSKSFCSQTRRRKKKKVFSFFSGLHGNLDQNPINQLICDCEGRALSLWLTPRGSGPSSRWWTDAFWFAQEEKSLSTARGSSGPDGAALLPPVAKKEKKRGTYELLKFLLWREHLSDSAVRARDSPSKMAREQHEATRYLDSARRCKLSELAPTWSDKQSERPSTSGFTAAGRTACGSICKHCSTEDLSSVCVCEGWEVGGVVPGCLRWWSTGSQTWHWLEASPPCLPPPHSADQSGLASSTLFRPGNKSGHRLWLSGFLDC